LSRTSRPAAAENMPRLPIYQQKERLVEAVRCNAFLVVTGETGSGKTTQLPQYLFQAGREGGKIGVTQPRRVAAITVAQRVSHEMGFTLGREVGYQVRFDDCTSKDTVIKYMTDGCMLREILADPGLTQYGVVILDEAHERSLNTDVLLGLMKKNHCRGGSHSRSSSLKVIVMSATLETEKLSAFFGRCPVFTIPGRTFPVSEQFCNLIGPKDIDGSGYVKEVVNMVLDVHTSETAGDILVFLTDQQRQIFQPPPAGVRKCVVATNIAATSLTISGIRYVVDSGFVKQLAHNSRVGMDVLEIVPISKSEAEQRAGRAGRTSEGKCFRIYGREFWEKYMPDYMVPEIQRTSLTSVILTLKCLGVHDVIRFPYLDAPEERFILSALKQLYQFDAIDRRGHVTELGRQMVQFPLPLGLTRVLLRAAALGCEELMLPIAAMLSVENVFIRPGHPEKQKEAETKHREIASDAGKNNDFTMMLSVFEKCKSSESPSSWCRENWIHWRAVKSAFSVESQLSEILLRIKQQRDFSTEEFEGSQSELFRQCLCSGYFTNVARRSIGKSFCTMDGHGSTVHIHPSSALFGEESQLDWIIFHDVLVTSRMYVRTVCPIRYEWVKDLLPKLHEVDAYELSNVAREEVTEEEVAKWESKEAFKRQMGDQCDSSIKLDKRSDENSITEARARYMQRKQKRRQEKQQ
uniref:RNA helicase n=1 Tax=Denticeps clupeoides TaxID=299321 RepID=A0AAY4ECJ7_9TELE